MVEDSDVVTSDHTKWYMAYRIVPFSMTLSDTQDHSWPWVTFKVIHLLQGFSHAIFRTFVQNVTIVQLTYNVARSLCDGRVSCFNQWSDRESGVIRVSLQTVSSITSDQSQSVAELSRKLPSSVIPRSSQRRRCQLVIVTDWQYGRQQFSKLLLPLFVISDVDVQNSQWIFVFYKLRCILVLILEMWANAQRDGRPAEHS